MKTIEGFQVEMDFGKFRRIADLIYYDGPFLSHYVSPKGDDYLFYWVDNDNTYNRWIVTRVSLPILQQYIARQIPLRDVIAHPNDGFIYITDVDNDLKYNNIRLVQPEKLPDDYLPADDSFYEFEPIAANDAPEMMTYQLTIPFQEHSKLESMLSHIGFPISALKKIASTAAVF